MKIEMGESLFYSWLRHVKECQMVQTNWKTSPKWDLQYEKELEDLMDKADVYFSEKFGYKVFKKTTSLAQLLRQAECDAIGVNFDEHGSHVYAVDVAFHESGLNYGDTNSTVMKIIAKSIRTALCIYGYFNSKDAEIVFATPKIGKSLLEKVIPCFNAMQVFFDEQGFGYRFRLIVNEGFQQIVLDPILMISEGVADTTELFLRSYQMLQMFSGHQTSNSKILPNNLADYTGREIAYSEFKIGKFVKVVIRNILESGQIDDQEILNLQDKYYSKTVFHCNFPVLVKQGNAYDEKRYYKEPVKIKGGSYMLCSQWFESTGHNDRPYIYEWIKTHA